MESRNFRSSKECEPCCTKNPLLFVIFSYRLLVELLISFPKVLVAAANGNTMGFGTALLALCDVVYASNKVCKILTSKRHISLIS